MTLERLTKIVERYGSAREAAGYVTLESAIRDSLNDLPDLLRQVGRLVGELERSVSDHEACIEIIHKSDDELARLSAALDAERQATAGMRAVVEKAIQFRRCSESRKDDERAMPVMMGDRQLEACYALMDAVAALDSAKENAT